MSHVSIHAPTGGATYHLEVGELDYIVSIHAPTGGATSNKLCVVLESSFNPRTHGGCDFVYVMNYALIN